MRFVLLEGLETEKGYLCVGRNFSQCEGMILFFFSLNGFDEKFIYPFSSFNLCWAGYVLVSALVTSYCYFIFFFLGFFFVFVSLFFF